MNETPVVAITGASSGIGAATARRAVAAGYKVVLAARSLSRLEPLAVELGEQDAIAVSCDVANWEDQQRLVRSALDRFGRLDVFAANAGIGLAQEGFLGDSVDRWKEMIDTNVYGVALSIRAALAHFALERAGHLVLTSSVAGRRIFPGSLYAATKFAVTAMGHALRAEVADTPIRVSLVEPGNVDTAFAADRPDVALHADDVAKAILFALEQPSEVEINEILVRPSRQLE